MVDTGRNSPPPIAPDAAGSVAPNVTDRRSVPPGVLPRRVQTWIMAGIAIGMLAIMLIVGRPSPPARTAPPLTATQAPTADRVRDYQERLRTLEAQALREAQTAAAAPDARPAVLYEQPHSASPSDPVLADRKRREYDSLFASNVVLSRRPEGERPEADRAAAPSGEPRGPSQGAVPSIDEIADAAVRASSRASAVQPALRLDSPTPSAVAKPTEKPSQARVPEETKPISAAGPLHRILEGTVIDAVLTNRLDGTGASPVTCLVTNPLYSHGGHEVLIPGGARVLGRTRPVQAVGEARLAVTFNRLLMPDGRTYRLDDFAGLNQIGDAGLRDRVNQHYLATFGAAAAVGLVSGLAQALGNVGLGDDDRRTVIVAGGVGDATSQATMQVMSRFLNRLPTITIREGHRVKIYLTSDLELPAYVAAAVGNQY
jgi:type IV secretion system protein TrbI